LQTCWTLTPKEPQTFAAGNRAVFDCDETYLKLRVRTHCTIIFENSFKYFNNNLIIKWENDSHLEWAQTVEFDYHWATSDSIQDLFFP
jgi:hypothetical protein